MKVHVTTRVRLYVDGAGIVAKSLLIEHLGTRIVVVDFSPPPWETRMDRVRPGDYVPLSALHQKRFNRRNYPLNHNIVNSPIKSI